MFITKLMADKSMSFFSQSAQLIENFLELAKNNTDKDLETCGVLGAFLVRFILLSVKRIR